MERLLPLGEVRNLLAGLCCPKLAKLRAEDGREARVQTALRRAYGREIYVLVVEVDEPAGARRGRGRAR